MDMLGNVLWFQMFFDVSLHLRILELTNTMVILYLNPVRAIVLNCQEKIHDSVHQLRIINGVSDIRKLC